MFYLANTFSIFYHSINLAWMSEKYKDVESKYGSREGWELLHSFNEQSPNNVEQNVTHNKESVSSLWFTTPGANLPKYRPVEHKLPLSGFLKNSVVSKHNILDWQFPEYLIHL